MIRILHTGDIHLTEGPRFVETLRCLDALIADGREQGVQLWLVGGDLSGTTVPHRATILEQNTLDSRFQRMAETAPVVILYGNHDAPGDLDGYARLAGPHPIHVAETPRSIGVGSALVFCFPYPLKRRWAAPYMDRPVAEQDRAVEAELRALLATWTAERREMTATGVPTLFLGHVTIGGCAIAGGEVMPPGQEIELAVDDLVALGCDYTGVSHIHLCQEMRAGSGIWYAGSPDRSNFGETDEKGHLIVDVTPGRPPVVHRRLTPARAFITVKVAWRADESGTWAWHRDDAADVDVAGAEVRVQVEYPEEAAGVCPFADLLDTFKAAGAHDVKLQRRMLPTTRVRSEAIATARTTAEKLEALWATLAPENRPSDEARARLLAKLAELERDPIADAEEVAA